MKLIKSILLATGLLLAVNAYAAPVDVNKADAATIAANIKGVGMKKAEAIVAYRDQHGPFKSLQELTKVKGIGDKILEKNRESIVVAELIKASR